MLTPKEWNSWRDPEIARLSLQQNNGFPNTIEQVGEVASLQLVFLPS